MDVRSDTRTHLGSTTRVALASKKNTERRLNRNGHVMRRDEEHSAGDPRIFYCSMHSVCWGLRSTIVA